MQWFFAETLFPVLDVIRLAVRFEVNNKEICKRGGDQFVDKLKTFISKDCKVVNNTLVAIRILCNLFAGDFGQEVVFQNRFDILENMAALSLTNKNIQV